ncbi:hypothetical protein J1N35_006067 [Gossypium stocksii]|uniref:Uncharacterized protein n=1 Tax=Gossypium stocksii TaxID=47602 RepID=A0A9D3WF90_9ROSI|nr:hypothetical protein J1N35_006067 [Gossypium stocksii]
MFMEILATGDKTLVHSSSILLKDLFEDDDSETPNQMKKENANVHMSSINNFEVYNF